MASSSQFDKLWCLEYDENSHDRSMVKINFSKYLNNIISNQYFPAFQVLAAKQLKEETEWNERCWAIIQIFQYFNDAFAVKEFQSNVKFKSEKKTRLMFGSFRMWIDLERLYLLCFLKMDRIEFQEDRIFFSLYRTMLFLNQLLAEYLVSDFKSEFLLKLSTKITQHSINLQKCLPKYMTPILKSIREIIPNFMKKQPLLDVKQKDQIKKIAFRKISRQYDMMPQIEQRLSNNIKFITKQREMKEISQITQSSEIQSMTKEVEHLYNPRYRIIRDYKKELQEKKETFSEQKLQELLSNYRHKAKDKVALENTYQSLMKTGHNPYQQSNYAIYGEALGIDMSNKTKFQNKEIQEEVQEQQVNENLLYYDPEYIERIEKMQVSSVAVTYKDLNDKTINEERDNHHFQDNSILLRNLTWKRQNNEDNEQQKANDDQMPQQSDRKKSNIAMTLRQINLKKNLENNALFMKNDEQQKQKSLQFLKRVLCKGLDSNVLFRLQKKAEELFSHMDHSKMTSIETKSVLDRNKFDSLRKVAQFHTINKKIQKYLHQNKSHPFYPRGIDEIKRYYVDTSIERNKMDLAFQTIFQ